MKTKFAATALIIASAMLVGSPSIAQVTREQVKTELAAAILSGDIATGERSLKLNELRPTRYPAKQVQSTLTREQVRAELISARYTGNYEAPGEVGGLCRDVHPNMHAIN